jgi:hypothetical protein
MLGWGSTVTSFLLVAYLTESYNEMKGNPKYTILDTLQCVVQKIGKTDLELINSDRGTAAALGDATTYSTTRNMKLVS